MNRLALSAALLTIATALSAQLTVTDYDGNIYQTVVIGNQVWMAENLKAIHYSDGTPIPLVENATTWEALGYTDKAYCLYDDLPVNGNIYGALYTWAAAMNGSASSDMNPSGIQGVCPSGWHLPSDSEWKKLEIYLGMSQANADAEGWRGTDEGGKLKETGTSHWNTTNSGATNSTGFTALPGGYRVPNGSFIDIGIGAYYWSSTEYDSDYSWRRQLYNSYAQVYRTSNSVKDHGFSVRCLLNESVEYSEVSHSFPTTYHGSNQPGDYDGDGDMDILYTGTAYTVSYSQVYRNDGDFNFTLVSSLTPAYYSSANWVDYDNDGDLDILISGTTGTVSNTILYENTGGDNFVPVDAGLVDMDAGKNDWGDYDNDGDLDLVSMGRDGATAKTILYRNDGDDTFTQVTTDITSAYSGSLMWGDFDNDMDLDLVICGNTGSDYISQIYRNDGKDVFTDILADLPGLDSPMCQWGDFNQDGYYDLLLYGDSSSVQITRIYTNNQNGSFSLANASLVGLGNSTATEKARIGDIDNDGDLDMFLTGTPDGTNGRSIIYRNIGNTEFVEAEDTILDVLAATVLLADLDNDSDLDLLVAGSTQIPLPHNYRDTKLYKNTTSYTNSAPSAPAGLISDSRIDSVYLSWDPAADDKSNTSLLTYNIRIGSTPLGVDIVTPHADSINGFRRIYGAGNAGHNTSWYFKNLSSGTYYWSVQAIDASYAGGAWSAIDSFTVVNTKKGLIAYYPFNGNSNDESGNDHHGSGSGAILTSDRFNNPNSAYHFDGVDDFISIPHHADFNSDTITISCWVNNEALDLSNTKGIIYKVPSSSGGDREFGMSLYAFSSSYPTVWLETADGINIHSIIDTFDYSINKWHQLVGVIADNNYMRLFIDGVQVSESSIAFSHAKNTNEIVIGKLGSTSFSTRFFEGKIDDISLYNRSLDSLEILSLYYEGGFSNIWSDSIYVDFSVPTPSDNFQVPIRFNSDVFDYSKAESDGSDIRFEDMAGNSLHYWIEKWNDANSSIVWVKVKDAGTSRIKMLYGNPYAVSHSNGDSTFIFFDDFEDGEYLDKWLPSKVSGYTGATFTESGGVMTFTDCCGNDTYCTQGPAVVFSRDSFLIDNEPVTLDVILSLASSSAGYSASSVYLTNVSMFGDPQGPAARHYGFMSNTYSVDDVLRTYPVDVHFQDLDPLTFTLGA